jgi:hypothetical protein
LDRDAGIHDGAIAIFAQAEKATYGSESLHSLQ